MLNRFLKTFTYFSWKIKIVFKTVKSNYFCDKKHEKAQGQLAKMKNNKSLSTVKT